MSWIRDVFAKTIDVKTMHSTSPIELRVFGLIFGTVFILIFGLIIPWIGDDIFPLWPWYPGILAWAWALAHPRSLAPLYHVWLRVGALLGWINTRIVLMVVYYMVITPVALMIKILGRDPMNRKLDPELFTYSIKRKRPGIGSMEKPF